ncbi:MAG: carbon storage regulator [Ruminococcaceae bacterium]|nr:carbon storage regulator [Oscillospiraceae bacterium]
MLLLTRKEGESLIIEVEGLKEPIELKIVDINNQVRIGVTAPKECKIWREELYQTIQANKQAAASVPAMPKANLKSMVQKLNK